MAGNITDLLVQQGALTLDGNKVEMGEVSVAGCSQVVKGTNYKVSGTLLAPCHKAMECPWMGRERLGTHLGDVTEGSGGQNAVHCVHCTLGHWPGALLSLPCWHAHRACMPPPRHPSIQLWINMTATVGDNNLTLGLTAGEWLWCM